MLKTVEQAMRHRHDPVHHPSHYVQGDLEVIDVIENWGLAQSFHLANAVKYILRHQAKGKPIEDLRKALWYVERMAAPGNRRAQDVHCCWSAGDISVDRVAAAFNLAPQLHLALTAIRRAGANRYLRGGLLVDAAASIREHIGDLKVGADLVG